MILNIKNQANFDFYEVEISTDKFKGGAGYYGGGKIKKGDMLSQEYIDGKDMNLEGSMLFKFVLIGEGEKKVPLKEITLELAPNTEYFFEVTGDSIEEADLKEIKEN